MRTCTTETTVKGMKIPLGLEIRVNNLALHFNPDLWGPVDPNVFYPSRYFFKNNKISTYTVNA